MALASLLGKASGVFGGIAGGGGPFGDDAGGATSGATTDYRSGGLQIGAKNVGSGSATSSQAQASGDTPARPHALPGTPPAWVFWVAGVAALGLLLYALLRRK